MISELYEVKPKSSYPEAVKKDIQLLKLDKNTDNITVIGSASYRKILYSGDLDFSEKTQHGYNLKTCISFFKKHLQKLVADISKSKQHYFMEIKCGLDNRYKLDIGTCSNGIFTIDYFFYRSLEDMYYYGLFDRKETDIMLEIGKESTQIAYETISEIIRKHYIVRWNSKEIKKGYKILPNSNIKYSLEEAINNVSPINIEILSVVNGKFIDESNFFYLCFEDNGIVKIVNFPQHSIDDSKTFIFESLAGSIESLYYSKLHFNLLKVAKRYYSLGRILNDDTLLKKVSPLLNSDIGYIGQIKSEIGTIMKVIEKVKVFPIKILKNQIQQLKYRISNIINISQNNLERINCHLDALYFARMDTNNRLDLIEEFKSITGILEYIINRSSFEYLENVGLVPPPDKYLPQIRKF